MSCHRCQALDMNGKQCRSHQTEAQKYPEIYNFTAATALEKPLWVKVYLCKKHSVGKNAEKQPREEPQENKNIKEEEISE